MAVFNNPNKPAGLTPVDHITGATWAGRGRWYAIPAADTSGYWPGDLVIPGTSAGNTFGAGGDSVSGFKYIAKYVEASTHPVVGVVQAVGIDPTGSQPINPNVLGSAASNYPYAGPGGGTYRPAAAQSITFYAFVIDDPNVIFEIQEGGTGTNLTQAVIGLNADVSVANPATVGVVGVSGSTLDNATTNTTSTLPLIILQFAPRADNGFTTSPPTGGGYQKWWVKLNNHVFNAGITAP